ncbi:MAG: dodecin family protein [Candidatus Thermoplasmatota archaeon]|nr:dodecin family protein [Candidatus Thermoplasmatota archaeon]
MTIAKVIEVIGSSSDSFDDAVRNAVAEAAKTVKDITGVNVLRMTAKVEDGRLTEFRANVKIAFEVKRN